jgi:hypothetical protein
MRKPSPLGFQNPLGADYWKYQLSGQAVRDGFHAVTGGGMGAAVAAIGLDVARSLFKKRAKKAAAKIATNVASDLVSSAIGMGIQKYRGGGATLPTVPPALFGPVSDIAGGALDLFNRYRQGGGGTAISRHPGAVALGDGTIWYKGHLYVYAGNPPRMRRVIHDRRTGQIVPAPKHTNVLNPHALARSMRRVEGFHRVASSALKHMEKWARKTSHRRAAPARPRGKK